MKPRNTSVGLIEVDGHLKVWSASFTLPGTLARKDGKVDEADRKRLQDLIANAISAVDFFPQNDEAKTVDREERRQEIASAIAKAEAEDLYDASEHHSNQID